MKKNTLRFIFGIFFLQLLFSSEIFSEKKALVVILSETRAHELTFENIQNNLIDKLQADVAVCIGVKNNYSYNDPFYNIAKYRFLYPEPEDYAEAFDYATHIISEENPHADIFPWRNFLKIKDQFLGGIKDPKDQHPGSAGILIFFRWFLAQNLLKENLLSKYDYFIITRSDFKYRLPHPPLSLFSENNIYIPNGEHYGGVTDRHVVLSKQNVLVYLSILEEFILNGQDYYDSMNNHSNWNLEQVIKLHLEKNNVWKNVKFFPYIMYAVRPIDGSTRWSLGSYSEKEQCYIKYPKEYELSKKHLQDFLKQGGKNLYQFYKSRIK